MAELNTPVSVGDRLDVLIVKLGQKGDGIAYVRGYVVFVPGTKVGDNVTIEVDMVKETFARARKVD